MSEIDDNNKRGLMIESIVKKYFQMQTLNPASNIVKVESHQRPNDPYDFIIYQKIDGRVYKKYVEVKTGKSPQTPLEKEFERNHPRSYMLKRFPSDDILYNLAEEWRSFTSSREWKEFYQCKPPSG